VRGKCQKISRWLRAVTLVVVAVVVVAVVVVADIGLGEKEEVTCSKHPLGCWSTAPHAVVLTLMREHYYCVYLYMLRRLMY